MSKYLSRTTVTLLLVLLLAQNLPLSAQQPSQQAAAPQPFSARTLSELRRIQQAALDSDYAYKQVAYLSNNIGPRLTGSAQAQRAVEYVAAELKKLGLEVKLEKLSVPHWVRGEERGELVQFPGMAADTTQKIMLTALGGSVSTPADGLTAEVVAVRDFEELQALGRQKVEGKIVLFNHAFDRQMAQQGFGGDAYGKAVRYRGAGPSAAAKLGAVAALVRSVGGANYRLPHTGQTRYEKDTPQIPAAAVAAEDAELIAYLAAQGRVSMHLVLTPRQLPDTVSYNVIADLKGSEHPEQVVIISGHLDSWDLGTGAIDDAAGVAIAMQTAQLIKALRLKPKRTIRVIAWMNEENGLVGGRTYAKDYEEDLANHFAAIESDLGAGHPVGINVGAKPDALTLLAPVSAVLDQSGAGILRLNDETGADISPLAAKGVPTFSAIQDLRTYFDYHHTAADTLDKIVPRELAENAAVYAVLTYALANMEQPLPR